MRTYHIRIKQLGDVFETLAPESERYDIEDEVIKVAKILGPCQIDLDEWVIEANCPISKTRLGTLFCHAHFIDSNDQITSQATQDCKVSWLYQ